MAGVITTIPIRWSGAATASCRSTSTCRAARRRRRRCSTVSSSSSGRSAAPAPSRGEPPMTEALTELATHIELKRPDCVLSWEIACDELTMHVAMSSLVSFVEFLRDDSNAKFSSLVDITAVDHPEREARFDVVYHFLSMYR